MHSKTFLEFHKVMGRGQILLYHFARPIPLSLFFLCSYFSGVTSNPYSYPLEWTFYFQVKLSRYVSQTSPVFLLRNSVADVVRQIFFLSLWNSVGLPYMTYGLRTSFVKGSVKGWDLKQWCYYLIYHKRNNIVSQYINNESQEYNETARILKWNIMFKNSKLLWIFNCWQSTDFYFYLYFQYWYFISWNCGDCH